MSANSTATTRRAGGDAGRSVGRCPQAGQVTAWSAATVVDGIRATLQRSDVDGLNPGRVRGCRDRQNDVSPSRGSLSQLRDVRTRAEAQGKPLCTPDG